MRMEKVEKIKVEDGEAKVYLDEKLVEGTTNPFRVPEGWEARRKTQTEGEKFVLEEVKIWKRI